MRMVMRPGGSGRGLLPAHKCRALASASLHCSGLRFLFVLQWMVVTRGSSFKGSANTRQPEQPEP